MHTQEQETEKKYKLISGSSTAIFFILLSLLLWYIKFSKPEKDEIPEELSVAVSLDGGVSGGGGSEGGPSDEVPVDVSSPSVPQMSLPSQSTEQTSDATAVPVRKTNPTPNTVPEISEEQRMLNDMIAKKKNQTKQGGGGSGPDFGDGGSGGGNGGGNGPGNGPGNGSGPGGLGTGGVTHNLGGRRLFGYQKVTNDCNTSGTVKLEVVVQPDGSISSIDDVPGYDDNLCLVRKAKAILRSAKFEQSAGAKIVTGQITINFKLQ